MSESALKSAKAVIKNGVEVGRSHASNHYGIEYNNITYAAPVIINGARADIMVNVADFSEYKDGQVYCSQIILDNGETYSLNAPPRTDGKKRKKTKDELWLENYKKQKAKNEQRRQQEEETKAEQSNNRMFMLNDNFVTELNEWYKGDRNIRKRFYIGTTSDVLSAIAGRVEKIYWDSQKINDIKKKHPKMTLPVIEQVPNIIEDPVMILDSRTVDGRIVMFGDVYDKGGNPVLAAVELSASNGSIDDFAVIASAYAKGEQIRDINQRTATLQKFIDESNVRYVTEDKKRIQSWLKRTGLQLPFGAKLGFNDVSISDSSENVNRKMSLNDSTGRELSKGQQEYFSESEVRDGKWRLLPVYHATDADFTEFKREYLGQMTDGNASSEYVAATAHLGFWFNTKDVSKSMWTDSSKTKEVYLNIENPYHTSVMSLADEMEAEYGDAGMTSAEMGEAYRDELISQGYDGIIATDEEFGGTSYVIFDSNQAKNTDNLNPTANPDIRYATDNLGLPNGHYDYSKSFAEQIEDYKAGKFPERDTFILGGTPDIYQKIGLSALPMTMDQTHVDYALNGTKNADHQLGEELLKQLPNLIKKPVAIIESATQPNNSAIVIVRGKVNEHQLMAAVHIGDVGKQNKIDIDSNHVASTQGRKNTVTKLLKDAVEKEANGETAVYYWNKTEALSLAVESGLQLPGAHISDGLLHSIFDAGSPVNRKYLEQTETRQFNNWFGKSVVRNADGTPEKVYHGAAANFTVFERGDIGYHVGTKAQAEDRIAGVEGGHVMELYARIKNPLYAAMDFGDWHGQNVAEMLIETEQFEDFDNRAEIEERLSEIAQMDNQQEADTALRKYLQGLGYDGIVYENRWEGEGESYIVFESSQLKSATDNIGLFDRSNPDIRYALDDSFRTDQAIRKVLGKAVEGIIGASRVGGGFALRTLSRTGGSGLLPPVLLSERLRLSAAPYAAKRMVVPYSITIPCRWEMRWSCS